MPMNARLSRADAEALLKAVVSLLKVQGLYPAGHGAIRAAQDATERALGQVFSVREPVLLGIADGYLVAGDVTFLQESALAEDLKGRFAAKGIHGALFAPQLCAAEVACFCEWLRSVPGEEWSGLHISLTTKDPSGWERGVQLRGDAIGALEDAAREIDEGRVPDPTHARQCVAAFDDLLQESPTLAQGLVLIKDYDRYTFSHSVNVCVLTLALGQHLGLARDELEALGIGGLFHDIGKTRTPVEIIRKPGRLTEAEFALIRWHPVHGREILGHMPTIQDPVPQLVFEHHMRYDGGGYPVRSEDRLHPLSQIITASDIFDAMTTHRSYSPPRALPEAMRVIAAAQGAELAPHISEAFVAVMGMVPAGTLVRLSTGEVGVISRLEGGEPVEAQIVSGSDGKDFLAEERPLRRIRREEIAAWINPLVRRVDPAQVLRALAAG
ncbi:MAG: HD domain-containing protein [Deltaproteobacteria bacterium]|nr:HD domain-containing protein [Deltaproteobacteria bacterium]